MSLYREDWSASLLVIQRQQQNLSRLPLAVVVLIARDNTLDTLRPLLPELLDLLERLEPRTLVKVGSRGAYYETGGPQS